MFDVRSWATIDAGEPTLVARVSTLAEAEEIALRVAVNTARTTYIEEG